MPRPAHVKFDDPISSAEYEPDLKANIFACHGRRFLSGSHWGNTSNDTFAAYLPEVPSNERGAASLRAGSFGPPMAGTQKQRRRSSPRAMDLHSAAVAALNSSLTSKNGDAIHASRGEGCGRSPDHLGEKGPKGSLKGCLCGSGDHCRRTRRTRCQKGQPCQPESRDSHDGVT